MLLLLLMSRIDLDDHRHREVQWRWKIRVAVGVGAGVPILLAIAFCLGMGAGERKARRKVKTGEWDWTPTDAVEREVGGSDVVVTESAGNGEVAGGPKPRGDAVDGIEAAVSGELTRDQDTSQTEAVDKGKAGTGAKYTQRRVVMPQQ